MEPLDRFDALFQHYADQYGLNWRRLKAQTLAESNLDPYAVSKMGAVGLAQFMPVTWQEVMGNHASPFSPDHAIHGQAKYMKWLLNACGGDYEKALAAYNWGLGNIRKAGEEWRAHLPEETRQYLARIDRILTDLQEV